MQPRVGSSKLFQLYLQRPNQSNHQTEFFYQEGAIR